MEENRYVFLGKLALKYRLSLENLCMIEGVPTNNETKKLMYERIINSNLSFERAFRYLFTVENIGISTKSKYEDDKVRLAKLGYETKGEAAYKRLQAKKYIDYLSLKQQLSILDSSNVTPEIEELRKKLESLESSLSPIDEEERQYKTILEIYKLDMQIREKLGREKRGITYHEALIASKYRLKYAISREAIAADFGLNTHVFEDRESQYDDEVFKIKLNNLNGYLLDRYHKGTRKHSK